MAISKTQSGWMVLGGLLCLLGVVLTCKLKVGNRASAQDGKEMSELSPPIDLKPPASTQEMKPIGGTPAAPLPPPGTPETYTPAESLIDFSPVKPPVPATPPEPKAPLPPPTPIAPSITPPTYSPAESKEPAPLPPGGGPGTPMQPTQGPVGEPSAFVTPPPAPPMPAPPIPEPMPQVSPPARNPVPATPVSRIEYRTEGEPPLAPEPGPVQMYHVKHDGETPRDIARRTLGGAERCEDVIKLNPNLKADAILAEGTAVRLPADACIPSEEVESVKPLPVLRKPTQAKNKALPLTGTFPCNLDDKHTLILPRSIRDQLGSCDTVLVSPGPDHCLWLTNHAHLERLAERLEHSPARETEVRVFRRLYYAQTEKVSVSSDGRVQVPEKLIAFAGLHQEVVLVGIDDHFELWDVARWKQYTQQKSAAARSLAAEE